MGIWDKRTKIMGRMEVWEGRKCGEKRNARNVGAVARKEVGVKESNMGIAKFSGFFSQWI